MTTLASLIEDPGEDFEDKVVLALIVKVEIPRDNVQGQNAQRGRGVVVSRSYVRKYFLAPFNGGGKTFALLQGNGKGERMFDMDLGSRDNGTVRK